MKSYNDQHNNICISSRRVANAAEATLSYADILAREASSTAIIAAAPALASATTPVTTSVAAPVVVPDTANTTASVTAPDTASIAAPLIATSTAPAASLISAAATNTTVVNNVSRPMRKKNNILLVGTNTTGSLKSIPKPKYILVSRLAPATSADEVKNLIKLNTGLDCEPVKFMAYSNEYSAFKIGVDEHCIHRLLQEDLWPRGVIIKDFIYHKSSKSSGHTSSIPQRSSASAS